MISVSSISSFFMQEGYRILKVIQYGAKTADECSPFGDDSNPVEGMDAIFCETEVGGEPVIIGYIQKHRLAQPGEKRIYSLDEFGDQVATDIFLKNDGTIEVGGNDDNFVSYKELNLALIKHATELQGELTKISTAIGTLGGVYVAGQMNIDISKSKTEDIKCLKPKTP
jgi:hypothetical protein